MDAALDAALSAIVAGRLPADLESETLDFKTQGRSVPDTLRDLAEAAACFANARGGSVVVGVADRVPGAAAFVGCSLDPMATKRRIFELTDPPLVVTAESLAQADRTLLVLSIPSSPDVHAVGGRCTERISTACEPMSTSRIATVVSERRGEDWSERDSGVKATAVDPSAIESARRLAERADGRRGLAGGSRSDQDLLRTLGLLTARGTLTNAGALLLTTGLGRGDQLAYVHRRTPAGQLSATEHLATPLLIAIQRVFDLVEARLERTSVNLPGGQQLQLADLPEAAIREAVINAVMHRDHSRTGTVQIEHTATRLVVTSPGPFVSGVTVDNVLTTASRSRNPSLCRAIRSLGLAETAGAGVDRMYAEMARVGHQPPTFTADLDQVSVTLLGGAPNTHLARFVASLPNDETHDADTMLTLLTLLTRQTVAAADIAPLLQKPDQEAAAVLERLAGEPVALLERTRESVRRARGVFRLREHAVISLGPAVTYRRRTADEYDRKIIGLIRETGEINARMVRLLLDLDAAPTSRVLGALVERGILVKTSTAQRGPNVTYGRGPKFPRRA